VSYSNTVGRASNPALSYVQNMARYRSLCANLVAADLRARFRRSRLGILWAMIQPLAFALVLALVWGAVFEKDYLAFSVYVLSGFIVWEYFSNTVLTAQDSLISAEGYLKQARIPLLVFQMRAPFAGLVTFFAGLASLFLLQAALGRLPAFGWHLAQIPLFIPLLLLFIMPVAIIFSVLGTQFRDLRHASLIAINALFFLSPIMLAREYLSSERLAFLQYANPIIPLLDLFRAPVLDGVFWPGGELIIIGIWIAALWIIAIALSVFFGRRIVFSI
jgi:lipopolysaccharide transport system permease protein